MILPNPLPTRVVERLFERLALTYGNQWLAMWDGLEMPAVQGLWAAELGAYAQRLDELAWALDHLPERPPNLQVFKALVDQAPRHQAPPELPNTAADPARVAQAMQSMRPAGINQAAITHAARGRTPAQACIDGLIERAERHDALNRAQRDMLASCLTMLRDDDTRWEHPVVQRFAPPKQPIAEALA